MVLIKLADPDYQWYKTILKFHFEFPGSETQCALTVRQARGMN